MDEGPPISSCEIALEARPLREAIVELVKLPVESQVIVRTKIKTSEPEELVVKRLNDIQTRFSIRVQLKQIETTDSYYIADAVLRGVRSNVTQFLMELLRSKKSQIVVESIEHTAQQFDSTSYVPVSNWYSNSDLRRKFFRILPSKPQGPLIVLTYHNTPRFVVYDLRYFRESTSDELFNELNSLFPEGALSPQVKDWLKDCHLRAKLPSRFSESLDAKTGPQIFGHLLSEKKCLVLLERGNEHALVLSPL
ncbi:MAG: hypothetical protein AB7F86_15920 [Bdellovibrionales bacterium]